MCEKGFLDLWKKDERRLEFEICEFLLLNSSPACIVPSSLWGLHMYQWLFTITWSLPLCGRLYSKYFLCINSQILLTTQWGKYCYFPYFTQEEAETQVSFLVRGYPASKWQTLDSNPASFDSRVLLPITVLWGLISFLVLFALSSIGNIVNFNSFYDI